MLIQVSATDEEESGVTGSIGQTYKGFDIAAAMEDLPQLIARLAKAMDRESKAANAAGEKDKKE